MYNDRVGAILSEDAQQRLVSTRVGKWPVSYGVVQGDEKQWPLLIFE
jgi:hypothetical protein